MKDPDNILIYKTYEKIENIFSPTTTMTLQHNDRKLTLSQPKEFFSLKK